MGAYVFQAGILQCCSDLLRTRSSLWLSQVHIEVSNQQQIGPLGPPVDGHITPHNMPTMPFLYHTEADNLQAMET